MYLRLMSSLFAYVLQNAKAICKINALKSCYGFSCTSRLILRLTCRDSLLKEQIVALCVIACLGMGCCHFIYCKWFICWRNRLLCFGWLHGLETYCTYYFYIFKIILRENFVLWLMDTIKVKDKFIDWRNRLCNCKFYGTCIRVEWVHILLSSLSFAMVVMLRNLNFIWC